jgi:hypothetical protein
MRSFNFFTTIVTAVYSTSNAETSVSISLGWLQNWKCNEGSNLVQINEIGKLACGPSLTMRCVGAVTPMVIEHQLFVTNLVLLQPCNFRLDSVVSPFVVTRQSCDTLRFARMDGLFLTSRPRVKPMKDSSEVDEIFRIDRSCEVMLRAMTATVPCRVFRANRVCHAHFS